MKNLLLRAGSGAIYVALIVFSLIGSKWIFLGLCLIFPILGLIEFYKLANTSGERKLTLAIDIIGAILMIFGFFAAENHCETYSLPSITFAIPYLVYLLTRFVAQLYTREASPLNNLAFSIMGQLYVVLPFGLMNILYFDYASPMLLLAMFIMIWLNDTGAYLVGCTIGRHRLFPRISPKKSWEGFFGGLAFTIGAAFALKYALPDHYTEISFAGMVGLAIVVTAFSTWGDLVESLIKRTLDVKDSGKMMPGHGGVLDRIDSLLLVAPAMLCYMLIITLFGC